MIHGPFLNQARVCESILRALPEWFGIEAAIRGYLAEIEALPTCLAVVEEQIVGFLALKYHTEHAAEIYVMGLRPDYHRRGLGRSLVARAEEVLRNNGIEYLQVKTLSPSVPNEHYTRARAFYHAMGFRALEESKQIWGERNPCLLMVKYLDERNRFKKTEGSAQWPLSFV